jgi:hypothetical protein
MQTNGFYDRLTESISVSDAYADMRAGVRTAWRKAGAERFARRISMVSICDGEVILRDFIQSDIEKRICWETEQTEWQLWDAPWEYEGLTDAQKQKDLNTYIEKMQA